MYTDQKLLIKSMDTKIMKMLTSETACKIFKAVCHFILIVFVTGIVHWGLVKFYSQHCVDSSWIGMFTNVINLASPFCQFINYIQFEISKYYVTIWASAGVAVVAYFIGKN